MKDYRLLVAVLVTTTLICVRQGTCLTGLLCESYQIEDTGILNGTETCKYDNDFCAVLWREVTNEQNEPSQVAVFKGCFAISFLSIPNYCEDDCIQRNDDMYNTQKGYGFCCCKVDMCNKNFTSTVNYTRYESTDIAPSTTTAEPTRHVSDKTVTVAIACVILALLAAMVTVVVIYIKYKSKCHAAKHTATRVEKKQALHLMM